MVGVKCFGGDGDKIGIRLSHLSQLLFLLGRYLLNPLAISRHTLYDGTLLWTGASCEKTGFLPSRSRPQRTPCWKMTDCSVWELLTFLQPDVLYGSCWHFCSQMLRVGAVDIFAAKCSVWELLTFLQPYVWNQHTKELISALRKTSHEQQQQRLQSPTVTLTWHVSKYKLHKLHQRYSQMFGLLRGSCWTVCSYA